VVKPRFSVVIPAYNCAQFLTETLDSVFSQTHSAHEIIVIDDGSTDETPSVLARYKKRVCVIRQPNAGVCAARNVGFERSSGDWVAFLDADDVWYPDKLARQALEINRCPGLLFSFCWYAHIGDNAEAVALPENPFTPAEKKMLLMTSMVVLPSTAVVRRDAMARFPGWAKAGEGDDCIYFNELNLEGVGSFLPEVLVSYRRHSGAATRNPSSHAQGWRNLYRWAESKAQPHGAAVIDALNQVLLETIDNARWSRNWDKYWMLRRFALSRSWPEKPAVLYERIWPPFSYRVKDWMDSLLRSPRKIRTRAHRKEVLGNP
jgi:glycosyltransferase involved in cell wall biosynthesis